MRDQDLIQIVDAAFADAARRSGPMLVCHPGCTQCCIGPFPVNLLDVNRLQQGMAELQEVSPARALRIRERAEAAMKRLTAEFPGDAVTGILDDSDQALEKFADYANEEPCPVLDPVTGLCELYEYRPMTCRVFGPPLRAEEGLGACELCYHGATDEEIAACEMDSDPDDLEAALLSRVEQSSGKSGNTIVAFAIALH